MKSGRARCAQHAPTPLVGIVEPLGRFLYDPDVQVPSTPNEPRIIFRSIV